MYKFLELSKETALILEVRLHNAGVTTSLKSYNMGETYNLTLSTREVTLLVANDTVIIITGSAAIGVSTADFYKLEIV